MRGLSFPQRLCYLGSLIYPIEGFQKFVFYVTPPIVLFTGILPMDALDITYLLHFIPYYALSLFAFNEMGRGYAGYLLLEQFSMGKFFTYLESFFSLLLPRRARQFKVTPKGRGTSTPYPLVVPQAIVFAGSVIAIVWAIFQLLLGLRGDEFIIAVNSLWALFNSGLAVAIILHARSKFYQRRIDFRIQDAVPVFFAYHDGGKPVRRLAAADDATETGMSLVAAGPIPADRDLELEIMLPRKTLAGTGHVMHVKTVNAGADVIARAGVAVTGPSGEVDVMSRYLHESAVSKFLAGYATRYLTYIESRIGPRLERKARARRVRAYLPAVVRGKSGGVSYGVIRNISQSGYLLAAHEDLVEGDRVAVEAVVGDRNVPLPGVVVRVMRHPSEDFPECVAGVVFDKADIGAVNRVLAIADAMTTLW